jgi:alkylated DNA repair protein alkB family protein 6
MLAQAQPSTFDELESYRLPKRPAIYLVRNFITEAEASYLLGNISKTPSAKWVQLRNRRLIELGGRVIKDTLFEEAMPEYLRMLTCRLAFLFDMEPNHILINEYLPGQGIMSHVDGPIYYPLIATVSLCSGILFNVGEYEIWVPENSLLVTRGEMYQVAHGIHEKTSDILTQKVLGYNGEPKKVQRQRRISQTCRVVGKKKRWFIK